MDPHLLRTFVAVARLRSFSAAARELGYTQSAVSQHIAALEASLGVTLVHRRPVAPTGAGERLLEHAAPLLLRLEAARADVARAAAAPATRLAVAVSALAGRWAAGALPAGQPRLDMTLEVLPREAVCAGVATGSHDLGLVDGAAAPNDPLRLPDFGAVTTVTAAQSPLVVVLPDSHPLAGRPGIDLAGLVDARWLDAPDTGIPLADIRAVTGYDGYRPAMRYAGTDVGTLVALVAAGHGLALLPASCPLGGARVVAVPVSAPRLAHRVEVLTPHHPSPPVAALAARLTPSGAPVS